ncbi:putative membrane protein (DUF2306) [Promicromonospora umidemergens]|uniref:DUF2306 domain-containing protein n=1 Tax=Promicromonospora umidemergens TaxID=629679 RepID=A0ABP8XRI2_9MICO|nr:DUF2306 domain-containing protein [Promicromonospora umidemergens]MCP2286435.1 putative membrane protein (DUF2306) [Promicromonospora umidemergens]
MATDTTTDAAPDTAPAPRRPAVRWWRRPWIAPLAVITAVFLVTTLPRYVGLDPSQALLPVGEVGDRGPAYYPALVTHIFTGSVLLAAAVLQLWPWLRANHPRIHRWSGRVYVVAAVLTGIGALVTAQFPSEGPSQRIANSLLAVLLVTFTLLGFRAVRQRRFTDHRAWMVRSTALAFSIVANRFWGVLLVVTFAPSFDGDMASSPEALSAAAASAWVSWVVNLLFAEWWLQRKPKKRTRAQRAR